MNNVWLKVNIHCWKSNWFCRIHKKSISTNASSYWLSNQVDCPIRFPSASISINGNAKNENETGDFHIETFVFDFEILIWRKSSWFLYRFSLLMTFSIISSKKTQNGRFPRVGRYIILELIISHRALAFQMQHLICSISSLFMHLLSAWSPGFFAFFRVQFHLVYFLECI